MRSQSQFAENEISFRRDSFRCARPNVQGFLPRMFLSLTTQAEFLWSSEMTATESYFCHHLLPPSTVHLPVLSPVSKYVSVTILSKVVLHLIRGSLVFGLYQSFYDMESTWWYSREGAFLHVSDQDLILHIPYGPLTTCRNDSWAQSKR